MDMVGLTAQLDQKEKITNRTNLDQTCDIIQPAATQEKFYLGGIEVDSKYVFIERNHVFAMIYQHPVTEGHVIVCPRNKQATHISQLTELEMLELFVCGQEIAKAFEDEIREREERQKPKEGTKKDRGVQLLLHDGEQ